jgi:protein TonB
MFKKSSLSLVLILAASATLVQGQVTEQVGEMPPPAMVEEMELPPMVDEAPTSKVGDEVYPIFDLQQLPEFPGGLTAMNEYLATNMKYPKRAVENAVQGTVVLEFIVEKDGSLTNIKVFRDIGSDCGKEAVRLVEAMPKWSPGYKNGQRARAKFTMPFRFKLE